MNLLHGDNHVTHLQLRWKSRDNDDIERAVRALNSSVDTTPTQVMSPAQSAKGSYNVVEYPLSANTSKNR